MKYLINYKLFESFQYDYGCIMLELPFDNWNEVLSTIDKEDIYDVEGGAIPFGLQKNPHVTLLYPVKQTVKYDLVKYKLDKIIDKDKDINLRINSIEVFNSKDYDVLVFRVDDNEYLSKIHNYLKKGIPNKNRHKDYKLHITIGYLKKGTGAKYCKEYTKEINNITEIIYTTKYGKETYEILEEI